MSKTRLGKRVWDARVVFRVQSRQLPPEKVEEDLGGLGYTMLSTQAWKLFQTAQRFLLPTEGFKSWPGAL